MQRIFVVAALVIAASTVASGQGASTPAGQGGSAEQAVVKVTNDWIEAEGRCDRPTLETIVADDFVGTAPAGQTVKKSDVLPRCVAGSGGGLQMSGQDIKARLFGDTAVVTGRGVGKGQGAPEIRFTVIFVKRQSMWQMVAGHLSRVPPEEN